MTGHAAPLPDSRSKFRAGQGGQVTKESIAAGLNEAVQYLPGAEIRGDEVWIDGAVRVRFTPVDPSQHGAVARFHYVPHTDSAQVFIDVGARPQDVARGLVHELAEVQTLYRHPEREEATQSLWLGSEGTTLNPHDIGRLAELRLLLGRYAKLSPLQQKRSDEAREIAVLVESLGLTRRLDMLDDQTRTAYEAYRAAKRKNGLALLTRMAGADFVTNSDAFQRGQTSLAALTEFNDGQIRMKATEGGTVERPVFLIKELHHVVGEEGPKGPELREENTQSENLDRSFATLMASLFAAGRAQALKDPGQQTFAIEALTVNECLRDIAHRFGGLVSRSGHDNRPGWEITIEFSREELLAGLDED